MATGHFRTILDALWAARGLPTGRRATAMCGDLAQSLNLPEYDTQRLLSILRNDNLGARVHAPLRHALLNELRKSNCLNALRPEVIDFLQPGIGANARFVGAWQVMMIVPRAQERRGTLLRQSLLVVDAELKCLEIGPSTRFSGWMMAFTPIIHITLDDGNLTEKSHIVLDVGNVPRTTHDLDMFEGLRTGVYKTHATDPGTIYSARCILRKLRFQTERLPFTVKEADVDGLRETFCFKFFSGAENRPFDLKGNEIDHGRIDVEAYQALALQEAKLRATNEQFYGFRSVVDRLLDERKAHFITTERLKTPIGSDPSP